MHIPSWPRKAHINNYKVLLITCRPDNYITLQPFNTSPAFPLLPEPDQDALSLAYKKVAKKIRPVAAMLPEDFRNIWRIPIDPLFSLSLLPMHPPKFTPGAHLMQERLDNLQLNRFDFLWQEELKLLHHVLKSNESGLVL